MVPPPRIQGVRVRRIEDHRWRGSNVTLKRQNSGLVFTVIGLVRLTPFVSGIFDVGIFIFVEKSRGPYLYCRIPGSCGELEKVGLEIWHARAMDCTRCLRAVWRSQWLLILQRLYDPHIRRGWPGSRMTRNTKVHKFLMVNIYFSRKPSIIVPIVQAHLPCQHTLILWCRQKCCLRFCGHKGGDVDGSTHTKVDLF